MSECRHMLLPSATEKRTVIIGVDGLGGSGKTTFAGELQKQRNDAQLFHLDDFIHPKKVRYNGEHEQWYSYYHLQWRYEYLIQQILEPLQKGRAVNQTIEFYDKVTDSYLAKKIEIPIGSTIIIEGVFLQRPVLKAYFDYIVFIDAAKDIRLERVLRRDVYIGNRQEIIDKYEQRYFPAEELYMQECKPLETANFIHKGDS